MSAATGRRNCRHIVSAEKATEKKETAEAVEGATKAKNFVQEGAAQLLGIRGAGAQTNIWKIRLQLTKPVTWVPLIWGAPHTHS